jgi:hypothetical protein
MVRYVNRSSFERRRRASRQREAEQTRLASACNSCSFHAASWAVFCDKWLPKINFVTSRSVQFAVNSAEKFVGDPVAVLAGEKNRDDCIYHGFSLRHNQSFDERSCSSSVQRDLTVSDKILDKAVNQIWAPESVNCPGSARCKIPEINLTGVFLRCSVAGSNVAQAKQPEHPCRQTLCWRID